MATDNELKKEGWVLVTYTFCQGAVLAESEEDDEDVFPVFYDTEEAAYKQIAEDMVEELQQFIRGERAQDEVGCWNGSEDFVCHACWFQDDAIEVYDDQGNPIIATTLQKWRDER